MQSKGIRKFNIQAVKFLITKLKSFPLFLFFVTYTEFFVNDYTEGYLLLHKFHQKHTVFPTASFQKEAPLFIALTSGLRVHSKPAQN